MNGVEERAAAMPVEECESRVAGHRMRYLRAGSGPAVVLLHGLMGYSFSFRFNIPELAKHFTVYAPDMLGIGFSDRPPHLDYSLRANAERILEWLDLISVSSLNLLGTSHGGGVATTVAALAVDNRAPRIERLMLVAAINPWSAIGKKRVALLSTAIGTGVFRRSFPHLLAVHSFFLKRMYGDPRRVTSETLEGYAAPLAQHGGADYGLGVVRTWVDDVQCLQSMYPKLHGIPTLLIWGDRDVAVSPASAHKLHEALPGSELVMLSGIGHLPYEECPDHFNRILLEFLQRH